MLMYSWLYSYDQSFEEPNGMYWELTEADNDEVKENMAISTLLDIVKKIKNPELKMKMQGKVAEISDLHSISLNYEGIISNKILDQTQVNQIISKEADKIIQESKESGLEEVYKKGDFQRFYAEVMFCTENYPQQQYEILNDYIGRIKSLETEENRDLIKEIVSTTVMRLRNNDVKEKLINEYYDSLTEASKKLIEFNADSEYIKKKAEKFRGIRIGLKPETTIGCELELDNDLLKRKINIRNQEGIGNYSISQEPTIDGDEFVTPIFTDTEDDIATFCAACETLKELGYSYDESKKDCGGHVNIGLNQLNSTNAILNFYEIYANTEEVLFHICNKEGQLSRVNIVGFDETFFNPISGKFGERMFNEEMSREEIIKRLANDNYGTSDEFGILGKKASVCIRQGSRLEFRMPNGSEDYNVWIDNIRLFGRMVEVSQEIEEIMQNGAQSERDEQKLFIKEELKDEDKPLEEKLDLLMDLLFEDDDIKKIYKDRFESVEQKIKLDPNRKHEYTPEDIEQIRKNAEVYYAPPGTFKTADFTSKYDTRLDRESEDDEYVWVGEYVPIDMDENEENMAIVGKMVEGYAQGYGITLIDLGNAQQQIVRDAHINIKEDSPSR